MAILKHMLTAALALALASCYETFTPDVDTKPVLCLNCLITAGEPVVPEVTHTWLYDTPSQSINCDVDDATVAVYVNGSLADEGYLAKEGDVIRIVAASPTYGTAEAEVEVPRIVPVKSISWEPVKTDVWTTEVPDYTAVASVLFDLKCGIEIEDSNNVIDYYNFSYSTFYHNSHLEEGDGWYGDYDLSHPIVVFFSPGLLDYEAEPLFSEHIGIFESMTGGEAEGFPFFTDRQFTGSSYPLHIRFEHCRYDINAVESEYTDDMLDCGLEIAISNVSESFYNWVNYLWQSDQGTLGAFGNIGLGDPVFGYSNVSTGAGVVAARAKAIYKIGLQSFLKQAIFDAD